MIKAAFSSVMEKRKAEILTAVLRLVDKVGITGLTTKRIAKEVGFAEGALYKHVDSKSGIFHLILEASAKSIVQTAAEIEARGLRPVEALGAWFDFAVSFLDEYPGIYRILFSDGLYAEDRALFNKFKECMFDLKARVQKVIEKGIADGDFHRDVDPERTAITYLGIIHTTFTLWTVFEERARSYKDTARSYFEEYLRFLRAASPEASRG